MLELLQPHLKHFAAYMDFVDQMDANGDNLWTAAPNDDEAPELFVKRILDSLQPTDPAVVPESHFWAMDGGEVVGRIALRHALTKSLEEFGGHIGYEVKPSCRRRGYATAMLKLLLKRPETQRIGKLLITCAPNNLGSNKTILACGGVLTKTAFVAKWSRDTNYYWIDLTAQP